MRILLDKPHMYSPGHGRPDVVNPMLMIIGFTLNPVAANIVLSLQYGNVENDTWVSNEDPFMMRIVDIPANLQGGTDPKTGQWVYKEITPANPVYSDMKDSFLIASKDVGEKGYDVVNRFLLQWLIDHGPYEGKII